MQQMQSIFNMRMEPIQTHEEYPKYARSETKPVVRARNIIDQGLISNHPCTACLELDQDCYRWEGTFSKCAYCTSKDKKRDFCHLPGQKSLPAPEKRKRRKITGNIYAPGGNAADTTMSGAIVSSTLAPRIIPSSNVPMSTTESVGVRTINPDPAPDMMETIDTRVEPPAEAGSKPTLERVMALENQVSGLKAKVVELQVKPEDGSSCVSTISTPRRQAFDDLEAQHLSNMPSPVHAPTATHLATREWVEGPKTPELPDAPFPVQVAIRERVEEPKTPPMPVHTIEHPEGYKPVNCSCSGP